jgi:nucleotide-binding universal stress UspA family protein
MNPEILIPTNGFKGSLPAIEEGVWLAKTLDSTITLLGVTERLGPLR